MARKWNTKWLKSNWQPGIVHLPELKKTIESAPWNETQRLDTRILTEVLPIKVRNIAIFCPPLIRGSGGHRTIFNLARWLSFGGASVTIFIESKEWEEDVCEGFPWETLTLLPEWPTTIACDCAIATIAHSASHVARLAGAKDKYYFIQDDEALFNPVGDGFRVAETSYSEELQPLTVGRWLCHKLVLRILNKTGISSGLGYDKKTYCRRNNT